MSTTSSVCTATALLALTSARVAQPPESELIAAGLPLEGAPLAEVGPYEVTTGPAFGAPALIVLHPARLDLFPRGDTLPVLVWGNGGCAPDSRHYRGFFSTIASHGFLVVGTTARAGASQNWVTVADLRSALDWVEVENTRAESPLRGKIAVDQIAVMGQSCGGSLSISLGADPRVDTIGVFNSGIEPDEPPPPPPIVTAAALAELHGPVLLVNGHESDRAMARSETTFDAIDSLPAFYGARHDAGHGGTVFHPGGGEFANVAANWLRWWFKGDRKAGAMFAGRNCRLCTSPNWDVETKAMRHRRAKPLR